MRAFYYDIVCPYAYMAFSFLHRHDVFNKKALALKPILLGGLFKLMEQPTNPNLSMSAAKSAYLKKDIQRQAAYFGAPLNFPASHPQSTLKAMRMLIAAPLEIRESLTARLYQAYWQEGLAIEDDKVLSSIAKEFSCEMAPEHGKELLIEATAEAFDKKIFGVPSFFINERVYFGGDRMALFARDLGLLLPDCPWTKNKALDFYFDFSSPYSYLAFKEVIKEKPNINFIPILLGAIFKERQVHDIPMLSAHPHKAAYYLKDMKDWANYRGINFCFNDRFPLRSVMANRVFILEPKAGEAMFDAAWRDNLDIGDESILCRVLDGAGFNGKVLIENSQNDGVKAQLRNNTAQAIERGVFGVPTFQVDDHLVFGQDRFPSLRMHLAGLNS